MGDGFEVIWQLIPSFGEEFVFRGVLLGYGARVEKSYLKWDFPILSVFAVAIFFGLLHPGRFQQTFDASVYFSLIFLATKSWVAAGFEHYLQYISNSLWG